MVSFIFDIDLYGIFRNDKYLFCFYDWMFIFINEIIDNLGLKWKNGMVLYV